MAELLTDADVAERLGVGKRWVEEQAKAGKFPHVKLGRTRRYKPEHIEEILQICEQRPRDQRPASRRGRQAPRTDGPSAASVAPLERKTPRKPRSS